MGMNASIKSNESIKINRSFISIKTLFISMMLLNSVQLSSF